VAQVHQAAVEADAELILDLLEQVRAEYPSVAEGLATLVNSFRFDLITALTAPAPPTPNAIGLLPPDRGQERAGEGEEGRNGERENEHHGDQ